VGFACRVVVDQSPGSGVRSRVDSQIKAVHHLFGRFLEAQKTGALVCKVGVVLDRGPGLLLGEVKTGAVPRHDGQTMMVREKQNSLVTNQDGQRELNDELVETLRWRGIHWYTDDVGGWAGRAGAAVGA
jgi:hypothetical protein